MIFITGPHGVGKTTLAKLLRGQGFEYIDLGPFIRSEHVTCGTNLSLEDWCKQSEAIEGTNFTDRILTDKIASILPTLSSSSDVVIVGSRSAGGINYILSHLATTRPNILIYLSAPEQTLYQRYCKREERNLSTDEFKNILEQERSMGLDTLRCSANYVLANDGTLADLHQATLEILTENGYDTTNAIRLLPVGTVSNPLRKDISPDAVFDDVEIRFPARLNAMALDPSKVALTSDRIYAPGELVFSVQLYTTATAKRLGDSRGRIEFGDHTQRRGLVKHAAMLMKAALGFNDSLLIDAHNNHPLVHAGLGSSGGLIASVATAINEMYGNPILPHELVRYLAQNHGEEIADDFETIVPVQCIGGSAASGLYDGGVLLLTGKSCVTNTMNVPEKYSVIIGVPKDYSAPDAETALRSELASMGGFVECGQKFGKEIAYSILHNVLPAMSSGDLRTIGKVIFNYRYNMGSIKNCSFLYPKIIDIMNNLAPLHGDLADVLSISSVGPGVFAITENPKACRAAFASQNLEIYETKIENNKYGVLK